MARFVGLIACLCIACGPSKPAHVASAEGGQAPQPPSEEAIYSTDVSEPSAPKFLLTRYNRLILEHGTDIYLVDPNSLNIAAKMSSPDGSSLDCVDAPAGPGARFLLTYRSGLLSLRESDGSLVANSHEPVGVRKCHEYSARWNPSGDRFVTPYFSENSQGVTPTGMLLWQVSNKELVATKLMDRSYERSDFLPHGSGIWVQSGDEYKITDLQGQTIHSFQCASCVLSPDEKLLIVRQGVPERWTSLVEVATGKERWRSNAISGHAWSPSMKWIFGTASSKEPVVVDARNGKIVARWFSDDTSTGRGAGWFNDVLVETDGTQAAVWKPGLKAPTIEKSLSAPDVLEAPAKDRFLAANAIWSIAGNRLFRLENADGCEVTRWSADNLYLSGYCGAGVNVWDAKTGKVVSQLTAHSNFRNDISWSGEGHHLLMRDEARRLIRHTPHEGTIVVTPHIENGNVRLSADPLVE